MDVIVKRCVKKLMVRTTNEIQWLCNEVLNLVSSSQEDICRYKSIESRKRRNIFFFSFVFIKKTWLVFSFIKEVIFET